METVAIEGPNHRIAAMDAILHEASGKVIIWARFRAEIQAIYEHIKETFGVQAVMHYYGSTSDDDRQLAVDSIQDVERDPNNQARFWDKKSPVQFLVANQAAAGIGLTLTNVHDVIYYSNDFSLYKRLQSEDRVHRIGLKNNVTYHDLACEGTIDSQVLLALLTKKAYADQITGDEPDDWLKNNQPEMDAGVINSIFEGL